MTDTVHGDMVTKLMEARARIRREERELVLKAAAYIDAGLPLDAALNALGVKRSTYFDRLRRAREL